ncbi:MAG: ATP-binding cassette domain-containing protein, partial [Bradyrhizobium sp.]
MTSLLVLDKVSKMFGGLLALDNVSVALQQGEVIGLIGPNGAGKTTFVNVVT